VHEERVSDGEQPSISQSLTDGAAILEADEVLVVVREKVRRERRLGRRLRAGHEPEGPLFERHLLQLTPGQLDTAFDVRHPEPRPPGEIMGVGRPPRPEIAARQFEQRLVSLQGSGRRHALVEQRVGELLSATRPAAHHGLELRLHHELAESLP
jgi:hypothetical protein